MAERFWIGEYKDPNSGWSRKPPSADDNVFCTTTRITLKQRLYYIWKFPARIRNKIRSKIRVRTIYWRDDGNGIKD